MSFLENAKDKINDVVGEARHSKWAHEEKAESDIEPDSAVAGSRSKRDGEDGSYVGRTNPQFDAETQESGAEARTEAARESGDGQ